MNRIYKLLVVLAILAVCATACIPPVVDVAQAAPEATTYQATILI